MTPPVFQTLIASPAVLAALGTAPTRVYPFGQAPAPSVADPYCVWQLQGGSPEIYLGDYPDIDVFSVQFDVYGVDAASVRAAAKAIRNAIEIRYPITAWLGESIDPQTQRYRLTFSSDWWVNR